MNCAECPVFNDCLTEWGECLYYPLKNFIKK